MRSRWLFAVVGCLALAACQQPTESEPAPVSDTETAAAAPSLGEMVTAGATAAGWKLAADPETFTGDEIYEYMDGEGEIPVACGYRSLAEADIVNDAGAGARIELYDMGTDGNAFGLYSLRREPDDERVALAHPAVIAPGQLIGWKGSHTFIVRADDPAKVEAATLEALAKGLEAQIAEAGQLPELVRRLPTEGLLPGSSRYFHGKFALDTIWFESENVLEVSAASEGAAATYSEPQGKVLVIKYPPQAQPENALAAWAKLTGATDDGSGHWLTDSPASGAQLVDGMVAVVMECSDKADVLTHLGRLEQSLGAVAETWPED